MLQTTLTEYLSSQQQSRTRAVSAVIVWRRYRETKSSLSHILPSVTVHWCVLRAEGGRVGVLREILFCEREGLRRAPARAREVERNEREWERKEERENSGWGSKICPTCPKYDAHIMHACTCTTNTLQVRSKMMYALGGPLKFSNKHTKK